MECEKLQSKYMKSSKVMELIIIKVNIFLMNYERTRHGFKKSGWADNAVLNISSFTRFNKFTFKFQFSILKLSFFTH
jgi:hypothetical protein